MLSVMMKINWVLVWIWAMVLSCNRSKPEADIPGSVKFFVDPGTNSDDPEIRMAYGLNIMPPWPDGGSIFVNLPEHLEYMPETMGIARHHDHRANVWRTSDDSLHAEYAVESLTEPNVFFSAKASSTGHRATLEVSITNRSEKKLHSLRPLFCFQYNFLKGFPIRLSDNFNHTFVIIVGHPVAVSDLVVENPDAIARMAQVGSCKDEHNWWAEEMGGFISRPIDSACTILRATDDDRKVVVRWWPGKNFLSNSYIPCIHADPCIGDLEPGQTVRVKGEIIFSRASLDQIVKELSP